jgi:hypothetical protein
LPYLDDGACAKKFPSNFSRAWQCPNPVVSSELDPSVYELDSVPLAEANVDTWSLPAAGLPSDVPLCLFLIKRAAADDGSSPSAVHTKRLCSGGGESITFQTWSSSKFIAAGSAAGHLRRECGFGFDGSAQTVQQTVSFGASVLPRSPA